MTGLFISIDDLIPDPEVEAVETAVRQLSVGEDYEIIPSVSNHTGWHKLPIYNGRTVPPRGERGRFVKQTNTHP